MTFIKRHRVASVALAILVVAGTVGGFLISRPTTTPKKLPQFGARFGGPQGIYVVPQIYQSDPGTCVASNDCQQCSITDLSPTDGPLTGGSFVLEWGGGGPQTAALPWNINNATLASDVSAIVGATVTASGGPVSSATVAFSGIPTPNLGTPLKVFSSSTTPTGSAVATSIDTTNWVDANNYLTLLTPVDGPLVSGSFTLSWNGETTSALPYTATAANIQSALNDLDPALAGVTATGGPFTSNDTVTLTGLASGVANESPVTIDFTQNTILTPQNPPLKAGTFTLSWNGNTTPALPYDDTALDIANQVGDLTGTAVTGTGGLISTTAVTLVGIPNTFPLTVNDNGITKPANGGINVSIPNDTVTTSTTGLEAIIRGLASGTEVDFQTNGCYMVNGGITIFNGGPSISFNGNAGTWSGSTWIPAAPVAGENAELYQADSQPDGFNPQSLAVIEPVIQEAGVPDPAPGTGYEEYPALIEHLFLQGHDYDGAYNMGLSDGESGIMLFATDHTTVNDVQVGGVWSDCLTEGVGGSGYTTNLLVENFTGNNCGRDGIAPVEAENTMVCGLALGATGQGNSFDMENDTVGNFQGSMNITVTGQTCDYGGVYASGCYFNGKIIVNTNPAQSGPYFINDCVSNEAGDGNQGNQGGAVVVKPGGTAESVIPNGSAIFSHDQFMCGFSGTVSCFAISGPYTSAVRSSTVLVSDDQTGDKEAVWNAGQTALPVETAIPAGTNVQLSFGERNTGGVTYGSTSAKISAGTITSVPTNPLATAIPAGADITVGSSGFIFTVTAAGAGVGAMTVPVDMQTINSNIAKGGGVINADPLTDIVISSQLCPTTTYSSNAGTQNVPPNQPLPYGAKWTYTCVANVTSSVTDFAMATGTDSVTGLSVPNEYTALTITVKGSPVPPTTTTTTNPSVVSNLNESAQASYGSQFYMGSDCITGELGGPSNSYPYGHASTLSTYSITSTTQFYQDHRIHCPTADALTQAPSATVVTPGTAVTDSAMIVGANGPGQPSGLLSFYVCGPTTTPQPCTSTAHTLGSVGLTPIGGGVGTTSIANTSSLTPFTPTTAGYYCFAARYPQTSLSATGYYKANADVSEPYAVLPQTAFGSFTLSPTVYDGCFDVS